MQDFEAGEFSCKDVGGAARQTLMLRFETGAYHNSADLRHTAT